MRVFWLIFGFVIFLVGGCALAMSLIGVHFWWLRWVEAFGPLLSFVTKVALTVFGVVIIILSRTNWENERREAANYKAKAK